MCQQTGLNMLILTVYSHTESFGVVSQSKITTGALDEVDLYLKSTEIKPAEMKKVFIAHAAYE